MAIGPDQPKREGIPFQRMDAQNKTQDLIPDRDSHRVYFYPPLHEQRQAWILDVLRGERPRISSILDIGCGEGTLLGVLCQPAECHPIPDDFDARFGVPSGDEIRLQSVLDTVESMYPKKIAGLDVSSGVLELARGLLEEQANGYPFLPPKPRWQELKVQLWKGGLEEYNPAFNGYDCIVSTEVIEHLPDDVLLKFCPMILGRYSPRIFLMTTPCYDFNQLFTPPDNAPSQDPCSAPIVREGGFLDPTGRTTRVFRHSDHKFEWTRDEFKGWCASQAEEWEYDVECGAIGRSTDPDPWGRDHTPSGEPLRATFTAIFRRRADRHHPPGTPVDSDPDPGSETTTRAHQPILTAAHPAHPSSHAPLPLDQIRDAVQERMLDRRDGDAAEVYDLWADGGALARACGGELEVLFAAVDALVSGTRDWEWDGAGRSRWRRRIVWHGYAEQEREREPLTWPETVPVDEDSPQEEDEVSIENSAWENQESGEQFDWEAGVENGKPDFGWGRIVNDQMVIPGGDDWNRDAEGWGSPPPVRAELDGWGDWDEQQGGEIKLDAGGW